MLLGFLVESNADGGTGIQVGVGTDVVPDVQCLGDRFAETVIVERKAVGLGDVALTRRLLTAHVPTALGSSIVVQSTTWAGDIQLLANMKRNLLKGVIACESGRYALPPQIGSASLGQPAREVVQSHAGRLQQPASGLDEWLCVGDQVLGAALFFLSKGQSTPGRCGCSRSPKVRMQSQSRPVKSSFTRSQRQLPAGNDPVAVDADGQREVSGWSLARTAVCSRKVVGVIKLVYKGLNVGFFTVAAVSSGEGDVQDFVQDATGRFTSPGAGKYLRLFAAGVRRHWPLM